jgi:hypothetical protein
LSPVRTERASSQVSAAENSTSYVVVLTKWPVTSVVADTAVQAAAMSWARRRPPISRAISPARNTVTPAASALGSRTTAMDPLSLSISPARTGVNGGWSG